MTVPLKIGEWDRTGPAYGTLLLSAKLTTAAGVETYGGGSVSITTPPKISDLKFVRDGQLFSEGVADAVGNFRVSVDANPGEAVAELRLIDSAGIARLTASAPFSVSRGTSKDALFSLDLSGLADGFYRAETRARGTDGYYGYGARTFVRVTHANQAGFNLGDDQPKVVGGAGIGGGLLVQGPLLSGSKPSTVALTVDGAAREVAVTPAWSPLNWQEPTAKQQLNFSMQGSELTVGTHQVELRLFDTTGRLIGKPSTRTVLVSDFKAKATAPVLVVGRRSTVTLSADGPTGHPLQLCDIELAAPQPINNAPIGRFCTTPAQTLRTTAPVTPKASGVSRFGFSLESAGGYRKLITQQTTVYAARRATVTAPAVRYGQRGTAKVTVQDNRTLGTWSAAPAGVNVTLQRQVVGSTAWATVGSVKTVAGGTASIPFTSVINGRFRAVLASSVPAETVITPTIAAVSVASVVWRSAPTTATRGRTVTYSVAAAPYDAGAVAYLQVRRPGSTVWTTVRTVAIPTSTVTNLTYAFPTVGTWSVRVLRGTTKQHAGGFSTVAAVKVQ